MVKLGSRPWGNNGWKDMNVRIVMKIEDLLPKDSTWQKILDLLQCYITSPVSVPSSGYFLVLNKMQIDLESSPLTSQGVSTPRMYPRSGYFLVILNFFETFPKKMIKNKIILLLMYVLLSRIYDMIWHSYQRNHYEFMVLLREKSYRRT